MVDHGLPSKEDRDPRDGPKHENLSIKSLASRQHGTERMLKHIHTAHGPLHHRILEAALYAGNALKTMVDGSAAGTVVVLGDGTHGGAGWEEVVVDKDFTFRAENSGLATIDGNQPVEFGARLFRITGGTVTFIGLVLTNGKVSSPSCQLLETDCSRLPETNLKVVSKVGLVRRRPVASARLKVVSKSLFLLQDDVSFDT